MTSVMRGILILALAVMAIGTLIFVSGGSFNLILPFYTMLSILLLGGIVFARAPRSPINVSFFVFTLALIGWSFSILRYGISLTASEAFFWALPANAIAAFMPAAFLRFAGAFPLEEKASRFCGRFFCFIPAFFFAVAVYCHLVIKEVVAVPGGFSIVPGILFFLYALYFVLFFGMAFLQLIKKYRVYTGAVKLQIKYVFLGIFLSAPFPIITNLVLPFSGNSGLTYYGPYFSIIFVVFTAYAIIRHRLMSIEVVIQRAAVYGISTVFIMAFYAFAVVISETYLRQMIGYTSLLITAFAALLIAVAYQPLVASFQNFTDRLFFRGRYDYQKVLRKISQQIASVIKLEELTRLIASSFVDTMKVSEISFLLSEKDGEHFRSVALNLPRYKRIEIDVKSPIISWLLAAKDILMKEEIEEELSRLPVGAQSLAEVRDEMDRLGISVWIPILSKGTLIGIIALGNKLSGDLFTPEDLVLLNTLANQTAVALDNARLYNEVVSMKNYNEEILQSMTNGVLTTDNRGRVVTYNFMAERILGRKAEEVMGKTCQEIWGDRGAVTMAVENTLKDRCYVNFETGIASPEKGLVPVSFSSTLLRDGQEKKQGALLSIHDLTDVKELEDKVRRSDKLSALATMAAGMAHEIKNPLSSMKVISQLLPKKFDDPEFRKKMEEILPREIDRIDRIIESLLGFARATVPTFEKVKAEEVLEATLKYFEDQAQNAGVTIQKNYSALPEIEVDREQISQVFSNLILNAIQAMPEGGTLSLSILPGKKVDEVMQNIKIQIEDTGHGISEEMQKKLFDPFFTTKYGGTGLGLTITHSVVDGHRGSIDVESTIGKGTTFTVTLPVSQGLI